MEARHQNSVVVTATADSAATTSSATQLGCVGQRLYVTGWDLSYTTATTGAKLVTLTYTPESTGVETTLTFYENFTVSDGRFPLPGILRCQMNTRVVLQVPSGGAAATGTLTSDGSVPVAGDTVTIGSKTYTFRASVSTTANEVKIGTGGSAVADTLTNLVNAITGGPGSGTTYGSLTTASTQVTASSDATHVFLTALAQGTAGNSIATTETSAHLSFGAGDLAGGAAPTTDAHLWLFRE